MREKTWDFDFQVKVKHQHQKSEIECFRTNIFCEILNQTQRVKQKEAQRDAREGGGRIAQLESEGFFYRGQ